MNLHGFTFEDYERLLEAAHGANYRVYTVAEYLRIAEPREPYVLVRHDVDRKLDTARAMARLEADLGIRSTYYLRPKTFDPSVAAEIEGLGHEVGYHYEDYADAGGDLETAHDRFAETLERFRESIDVETVCAHGSPRSPHNNLDMWRRPESPPLEAYDLLGEAYLTPDVETSDPELLSYISDTGRNWRADLPGYGHIEKTADIANALEARACSHVYLLVHPERWARTGPEFIERALWDLAAETGKFLAGSAHRVTKSP